MEKYLILIAGLPGAGKTTTAKKLSESLKNFVLIEQNEIRRKHGIKRMPKTQEKVLLEIDKLAMEALLNNKNVIIESGNRYTQRRHQIYGIASACGAKVVLLECICSEQESKRRIRNRIQQDSLISDPKDVKVYDRIKELWENIELDFKYPYQGHYSYITFNTEKQEIETKVPVLGTKIIINKIKEILIEKKRILSSIKAIGFDLDQTLYSEDKEMNILLRNKIAQKILEKKPELDNLGRVLEIYEEKYKKIGSWTKIFKEVGFENPKEIMKNCLSGKKIVDLIKEDKELLEIIKKLKENYQLFLITSNPKDLGIAKLNKLGLDISLFDYSIFGDDEGYTSKVDAIPFKIFLEKSSYLPRQHVYIGDSLKADILPAKSLGMKTIAVGKEIPDADISIKKIHTIKNLFF